MTSCVVSSTLFVSGNFEHVCPRLVPISWLENEINCGGTWRRWIQDFRGSIFHQKSFKTEVPSNEISSIPRPSQRVIISLHFLILDPLGPHQLSILTFHVEINIPYSMRVCKMCYTGRVRSKVPTPYHFFIPFWQSLYAFSNSFNWKKYPFHKLS